MAEGQQGLFGGEAVASPSPGTTKPFVADSQLQHNPDNPSGILPASLDIYCYYRLYKDGRRLLLFLAGSSGFVSHRSRWLVAAGGRTDIFDTKTAQVILRRPTLVSRKLDPVLATVPITSASPSSRSSTSSEPGSWRRRTGRSGSAGARGRPC